MSNLKDKFFWESYGKYSLVAAAGFGIATIALGVPSDVTLKLGAGALLGFPAAYTLGVRRSTPNSGDQNPPPAP